MDGRRRANGRENGLEEWGWEGGHGVLGKHPKCWEPFANEIYFWIADLLLVMSAHFLLSTLFDSFSSCTISRTDSMCSRVLIWRILSSFLKNKPRSRRYDWISIRLVPKVPFSGVSTGRLSSGKAVDRQQKKRGESHWWNICLAVSSFPFFFLN